MEVVAEIATASNEQSEGIRQINQAMGQIDAVTQRNAASAEEGAAASEELSAQTETMKEIVTDLVNLVEGGTKSNTAYMLTVPEQKENNSNNLLHL